MLFDLPRIHLSVGKDAGAFESFFLYRPGPGGSLLYLLRRLGCCVAEHLGCGQGTDLKVNINAVDERSGNLGEIFLNLQRRAVTFPIGIGEISAWARVHGSDEHEFGGKVDRACRAGYCNLMVLERLAQGFEHIAVEFGQLIQKENAVMRQRDLSGFGDRAASHQRHVGGIIGVGGT